MGRWGGILHIHILLSGCAGGVPFGCWQRARIRVAGREGEPRWSADGQRSGGADRGEVEVVFVVGDGRADGGKGDITFFQVGRGHMGAHA